jgi:ribosome biogenesis GTPase
MTTREELGWGAPFASACEPGERAARVLLGHREGYRVSTGEEEIEITVPGRVRRAGTLPAVGDWVVIEGTSLVRILPRRTRLARRAAGDAPREQLIAANVDTVVIVMGLDNDFNPPRLERYLELVAASGARAAVLLTKADMYEPRPIDVPIVSAVDARSDEALRVVEGWMSPGQTLIFLGSSGVGKSTITNRILGGEIQRTGSVREHDSRGRHTTTSRRLFLVPGKGMIIDTPGIREVQRWDEGEDPQLRGERRRRR